MAGIVSFIQGYPLGTIPGANGNLAGFVRVSLFNEWIDYQLPTRYWKTAASGSFGDGANWTEDASPTAGNIAVFNEAGTYTASLTNNVANKRMRFRKGEVTLDLGGHTYTLSDTLIDPSIIVGQRFGDDTKLTIVNGNVNAVDVSVGQMTGSKGTLTVNQGASLQIAGKLSVHGTTLPDPVITNIINKAIRYCQKPQTGKMRRYRTTGNSSDTQPADPAPEESAKWWTTGPSQV